MDDDANRLKKMIPPTHVRAQIRFLVVPVLHHNNRLIRAAVVVAQLVERSLPKPGIRGSNPVIGNIFYYQLYLKSDIEKTKIKKKEAANGLIKSHLAMTTF